MDQNYSPVGLYIKIMHDDWTILEEQKTTHRLQISSFYISQRDFSKSFGSILITILSFTDENYSRENKFQIDSDSYFS
jgi:hypothetical protein